MNLNVQKTYKLLKFLNRKPLFIEKFFYAISTFILVFLLTFRITLAREIFDVIYHQGNLLLGMRRCAWYLKRSKLALIISDDYLFDFTDQLNEKELESVEKFLKKRASSLPHHEFISDALCISARRLTVNRTQSAINDYYTLADQIIQAPSSEANTFNQKRKIKQRDRKPDFDVVSARLALKAFSDLFPISNTPWFIISGTFLGLIRQGDFLRHDYDIDIGIFSSDFKFSEFINAIATSKNFSIKKIDKSHTIGPNRSEEPVLIKIIHESGVHIDFFIHHKEHRDENLYIWHGSSIHRWDNSTFTLKRYNFGGTEVFGPAESDKYLTENYGDWRTEVKNFSCTTDTPNFSVCFEPIPVSIILRRLCLLKTSRPTEVDELMNRLCTVNLIKKLGGKHKINDIFS